MILYKVYLPRTRPKTIPTHMPHAPHTPLPENPHRTRLRLESAWRHAVARCLIAAGLLALAACANPGSGPDGGPYDETPPRLVSTSPALGQRNTKAKKVTLLFNELVKLENASEKVIVSPPQIEMPEIKTSGRRITVTLADSLKENTTYTIDFSDAIEDSNEGNPMGSFTYFFSTGARLDTMEVSGHVLDASNLEPVQGILVGLHTNPADSAFRTMPFDRVARTDSRGYFSVKGVAPGSYRIYALKDMDGDFRFSQKSEMIAYSRDSIRPSSFPDVRHDTLWVDSIHYDSIRTVPYTHFTPDDIVLLAFQESGQPRHLLKTTRENPENFTVFFTAPSAEAPSVSGIGFDAATALKEDRSPGNDTITYWVCDTTLLARDTLAFVYTYQETDDSTGTASLRSDTLELVPKTTMAKKLKAKADEMERWKKQLEKRHKRGDYSNEDPPRDFMKINARIASNMAPDQNLHFSLPEPAQTVDTAAIHLFLKVDSLLEEAPFRLERDDGKLLQYTIYGEWRPGQEYTVRIDSAAITNIYGTENQKWEQSFSIAKLDEFATLFVHLPGADSTAVVQLLSADTKVERQVRAPKGRADFYYIKPGTYYLRAFLDLDGNGTWDSGSYDDDRQAEQVFYYHKKLELRANWDVEETWMLKERPLTSQKPADLTKQKSESTKQTAHSRNLERLKNR